MKTLKFKDAKAKMILAGEKTATLRLFDDKGLSVGDVLELINSDTGEKFGRAQITFVIEKSIKDIEESDLQGHEKYKNKEDVLENLRSYYGDKVSLNTPAKIIYFGLI
jgi:hypothetical protein